MKPTKRPAGTPSRRPTSSTSKAPRSRNVADGGTDIHILDDPSDGHGTAVTGAVLDANPDAVIFFVEGFSTEAVLAAGNQPLVDMVTTWFGAFG